MASNVLNIGQSALAAAQVGISTTGHNIANASTPGYSRQIVVQSAAQAQNFGYGYIGQGTQVATVQRIFSDLLARQVSNSQSTANQINTYASQMRQLDNMLSDSTAGLAPAMQDFFNSLQVLSSNPSDAASRQAMLSSAQSLANRFQSMGNRIYEIRESVNTQITSSVSLVNTYAKQIGQLNDAIEKAITATGNPPNDLMDQRDKLVADLSKEIKTSVVSQDGGKYNVFIGNGLPLVVGTTVYGLTTANSPTDPGRLEIAYVSKDKVNILGESSVTGGTLGGLIDFRNNSLDDIQNQLGLIAVTLAQNFNDQHAQALDANGKPGAAFFSVPSPLVGANIENIGDAAVDVGIVDVKALTGSDYRLQFDGTNYKITRLSDGQVQTSSTLPLTLDGLKFSIQSGTMLAGDDYKIQPTANGASAFAVTLKDITKIATGAPVATAATATANTGNATISAPVAAASYSSSPLASAFTLSYDNTSGNLSGFPAGQPITVTVGGVATTYAAGSAVPYTSGAEISVAGLSFKISGTPADTDQFTIGPGSNTGPGDNRNGLLLAALQNINSMNNGTTTYAGSFGQLVSMVGNKTRELQVTGAAENQILTMAVTAQESESGVNLDEEATNLLRYQQAYQAAGKMMQIASQLFDVILALGR